MRPSTMMHYFTPAKQFVLWRDSGLAITEKIVDLRLLRFYPSSVQEKQWNYRKPTYQ